MNRYQWHNKMTSQSDNSMGSSYQIQNSGNIATNNIKDEILPVMEKISQASGFIWNHREQLNNRLARGFKQLNSVSKLFCLDANGIQVTRSLTRYLTDVGPEYKCDHSQRSYMREMSLSDRQFISRIYFNYVTGRQTVTVVHTIKNSLGTLLGYLCAELDMADMLLLVSKAYLKDNLEAESQIPRHLLLQ